MRESLLLGKTALITGAASGIGAAAAQMFSEQGAAVVLADINEEGGLQVSEAVVKDGGQAVFVRADVRSPPDVAALVQSAVDSFGRLDCAFNNAGIDRQFAPLHESSKDNWDDVLGVNLTGVWLCLKYEIAQMLEQGSGAIVNRMILTPFGGVGLLEFRLRERSGRAGVRTRSG